MYGTSARSGMRHSHGHSHQSEQSLRIPIQKMTDNLIPPCRMDLHPRRGIHGKTGTFGQMLMTNRGVNDRESSSAASASVSAMHNQSWKLEMMLGEDTLAQQLILLKGALQAQTCCRCQIWTKSC